MQSGYGGQILCDSDDEDESMPRKPPSRHIMRVGSLANTQRVAETNRSQAALEMDCDEQEDNWPGVLQEGKRAEQGRDLVNTIELASTATAILEMHGGSGKRSPTPSGL